jgi:DNA-binding transcriptional ArsR family regulator
MTTTTLDRSPDAERTRERGGLRLAELFRLLSDPTRVELLLLLAEGERNVTGLCEALGLPQPTASHHLGLLRSSGLLGARRAGKQIFYGLADRVRPAEPMAEGSVLTIDGDGFTVRIALGSGEAAEASASRRPVKPGIRSPCVPVLSRQ